jgi:hypothetical protein
LFKIWAISSVGPGRQAERIDMSQRCCSNQLNVHKIWAISSVG